MIWLFISSLIYLFLISIIYYSKEKVKTKDTMLYSIIIGVNIFGLSWDFIQYILTFFIKNNLFLIIINKAFLIYVIGWATLFGYYVFTVEKNSNERLIKKLLILFSISSTLIIFLPETHNYSSVTGPAVYLSYGYVALIIILMVISTIKKIFIEKATKKKFIPLFSFIILGGIGSVIQFLNPEILLTSPIETFITIMTYFFIENPDVKMIEQLNIERDRAEKANMAKSDFLSSMSHEIRTPLNAIVGMSEDITSYAGELPTQIKEDAQDIQVASQNLLEIVGNILDISKIESDKMEIVDITYNFKEEAKNIAKIDATRLGDKPIDFKVHIAEDIPEYLIGDKVHMKEILNNLLTNAIKYTEEGSITFVVKCINMNDVCNLIISVEDTGRGIKQEDIDKLFTKFERLGVEKNSTTEGTGLGLAITKKLIEMMGGKITVTSTYGKGSLFMVNIPQKIDKANTNVSNKSDVVVIDNVEEQINYRTKKILIVDDNPLNIKVACRALSNLNINIESVTSGEECINKINAGNYYDVILMDIMMPGMSGETTFNNLKSNPNFVTPVIALTADAISGAKEKYVGEGFVDYIAKPFSKNEIKEKLDEIFKNKM